MLSGFLHRRLNFGSASTLRDAGGISHEEFSGVRCGANDEKGGEKFGFLDFLNNTHTHTHTLIAA